jgi:hypothetical protein
MLSPAERTAQILAKMTAGTLRGTSPIASPATDQPKRMPPTSAPPGAYTVSGTAYFGWDTTPCYALVPGAGRYDIRAFSAAMIDVPAPTDAAPRAVPEGFFTLFQERGTEADTVASIRAAGIGVWHQASAVYSESFGVVPDSRAYVAADSGFAAAGGQFVLNLRQPGGQIEAPFHPGNRPPRPDTGFMTAVGESVWQDAAAAKELSADLYFPADMAVSQFRVWGDRPPGLPLRLGVARYTGPTSHIEIASVTVTADTFDLSDTIGDAFPAGTRLAFFIDRGAIGAPVMFGPLQFRLYGADAPIDTAPAGKTHVFWLGYG